MRGHIPALDGLRGLAILLVLVQHAYVPPGEGLVDRFVRFWMDSGWLGVDLFFVLSGFLISGLLLDARAKPGYFRNFYARRVLRIFPVYYLVLAFMFLVAPRLGNWVHTEGIGGTAVWYVAYLANVHAALRGPTFTALGPTWSLAVEEQFYLVWPLIVLLCNRRRLTLACIAIIVLAPLIRVGLLLGGMDLWGVYALTPARMDGFALGAGLALLARSERRLASYARLGRTAVLLGGTGLVALAVWQGSFRWDTVGMETAGFSLGALAFGGLLWLAIAPGRVAGWLQVPVLRSFGRYSYAIYLLQVPILEVLYRLMWGTDVWTRGSERLLFGSPVLSQLVFCVILATASWSAGWLSWHLLEQHVLALKRFVPYARDGGQPAEPEVKPLAAVLAPVPVRAN
ncbi:MAG TPA: acyltransferase [Chloroflexota bacterium]|nr:acyltransferase [Chloroflexota bacterium]